MKARTSSIEELITTGGMFLPNANVNSSLKYETPKKVVTGAWVLSHGNADVERGLSDNKKNFDERQNKLSYHHLYTGLSN